jgi:hypothetical protein
MYCLSQLKEIFIANKGKKISQPVVVRVLFHRHTLRQIPRLIDIGAQEIFLVGSFLTTGNLQKELVSYCGGGLRRYAMMSARS